MSFWCTFFGLDLSLRVGIGILSPNLKYTINVQTLWSKSVSVYLVQTLLISSFPNMLGNVFWNKKTWLLHIDWSDFSCFIYVTKMSFVLVVSSEYCVVSTTISFTIIYSIIILISWWMYRFRLLWLRKWLLYTINYQYAQTS